MGGLNRLKAPAAAEQLLSAAELEARWTAERGADSLPVSMALTLLASEVGLGINALRRHMNHVGFSPRNPFTLEQVKAALEALNTDACCNSFGVTFAEGSLRSEYGMVVRRS